MSRLQRRQAPTAPGTKPVDDLNVDAVFAKLKTIGGKKQDDEE